MAQNVGRGKHWQNFLCIWMGKLKQIEQVFYYMSIHLCLDGENSDFGKLMDGRQICQCFLLPTFHIIRYGSCMLQKMQIFLLRAGSGNYMHL